MQAETNQIPGHDPNLLRRADLTPHFEEVDGRKVFYVDGWPFTILSAEITWYKLIQGRHREAMHAYDHLYPAAKAIGLNTLKVPSPPGPWICRARRRAIRMSWPTGPSPTARSPCVRVTAF